MDFTVITTKYSEFNFPLANSNVGGVANTTVHSFDPLADNANGTSTGFSAATSANDPAAAGSATYITKIRDMETLTGQIQLDIIGLQTSRTTFNDEMDTIYSSTTDVSTSGRTTDAAVGGLGRNLGSGNT